MNRPLVFVAVSLMAGIWAAAALNINPFISLSALIFFAGIYFFKRKDILILALFAALGAMLFGCRHNLFPSNHIRNIDVKNASGTEVVIDDVPRESEKRVYFNADVRKVYFKDYALENVEGRARVSVEKKMGGNFEYGDVLEIKGSIRQPSPPRNEGGFNYGEFLEKKGIYHVIYAKDYNTEKKGEDIKNYFVYYSLKVKKRLLDIIYSSLPRGEAKILDGIMLGNQKAIPDDIYDKFKITGTVHILAVSGMNVGLIALFIFFVLKLFRVKRKAAAAVTMVFVAVFAVITGADASIVRASIMAFVMLTAVIIERDADVMNSLAAAAFIILIFSPSDLFDVSFQLSFLATFGLIYMTTWAMEFFRNIPKPLAVVVVTTITAQVFLVPVLVNVFNQFSLISVIANIFIVPLSSLITILGFVMWAAGTISAETSRVFGASIWALVKAMLFIIDWLSKIPYAAVSIRGLPAVFILFYFLFFLTLPHSDIDLKIRKISLKACAGIFLFAWAVLHLLYPAAAGKYYVISARGVDSVFLNTKGNSKILFLGYGDYKDTFAVKNTAVPFLRHKGINNIDFLVLYSLKNSENIKILRRNFAVKRVLRDEGSYKSNFVVDGKTVMHTGRYKAEVKAENDTFIFTKLLTRGLSQRQGAEIYACFYSKEKLLKTARKNKIFINSLNRKWPLKLKNENIYDAGQNGMAVEKFE